MSYLKQLQLKNEGLRRVAEENAVRVGLLARCPFGEATYDPLTWLHVEAYRLANWLISHRVELVEDLGGEPRRRLTDILQYIDRDYSNGCRCGARPALATGPWLPPGTNPEGGRRRPLSGRACAHLGASSLAP